MLTFHLSGQENGGTTKFTATILLRPSADDGQVAAIAIRNGTSLTIIPKTTTSLTTGPTSHFTCHPTRRGSSRECASKSFPATSSRSSRGWSTAGSPSACLIIRPAAACNAPARGDFRPNISWDSWPTWFLKPWPGDKSLPSSGSWFLFRIRPGRPVVHESTASFRRPHDAFEAAKGRLAPPWRVPGSALAQRLTLPDEGLPRGPVFTRGFSTKTRSQRPDRTWRGKPDSPQTHASNRLARPSAPARSDRAAGARPTARPPGRGPPHRPR